MLIHTTRFGEIELKEQELWTMKKPIFGFEKNKKFVILPQKNSPFEYYQAVDDEHLTFVLADPFFFFKQYEFSLEQRWADMLVINDEAEISIRSIVTVRSSEDISLNLKAPLIMNNTTKEAAQVILDILGYTTRHSIVQKSGRGEKDADSFKK